MFNPFLIVRPEECFISKSPSGYSTQSTLCVGYYTNSQWKMIQLDFFQSAEIWGKTCYVRCSSFKLRTFIYFCFVLFYFVLFYYSEVLSSSSKGKMWLFSLSSTFSLLKQFFWLYLICSSFQFDKNGVALLTHISIAV